MSRDDAAAHNPAKAEAEAARLRVPPLPGTVNFTDQLGVTLADSTTLMK